MQILVSVLPILSSLPGIVITEMPRGLLTHSPFCKLSFYFLYPGSLESSLVFSLYKRLRGALLVVTQYQHSEAGLEGGKAPPAWSESIWLFIVNHVIKRPLVCDSSEVKKGLYLLMNTERDSCMRQLHTKAFIPVCLSLLSHLSERASFTVCFW